MSEVLYRYEDHHYAPMVDEWDHPIGIGSVEVTLHEYQVLKRTPKGVWLDLGFGTKRFVLTDARRRWACPTIDEARESFRARKRRQISIHEARADKARRALARFEMSVATCSGE